MTLFCNAKNSKIPLKKNEIHLWQVNPDNITQAELLNKYKDLLNDDETKKQQRYKFTQDRHYALITRAFVRDLLSYYADIAPSDWRFDKGEKGKPEIINPPLPLRFNISHTKGLIICVVTLADDIGCDVENTTRTNDVLSIAERYFSSIETKELFSLPREQQRHRFFDYWTLKESYIKAWGSGLTIPLKDFSFILDDVEQGDAINPNISKSISENIHSNIQLNFAEHSNDDQKLWRSWLLYPNNEHRIAISIKASQNNQETDYKLRFFYNTPLSNVTDITYANTSAGFK